jgi:5-methylcytosine-specific restriction endonuclease McrA
MVTRAPAKRSTTRRDKHRRAIAKGKPPCHLCHEPIDYNADWLDPLSFTIDHIIPIARGGADVLENLAPAHRKCNRDKSDGTTIRLPVTFITDRTW